MGPAHSKKKAKPVTSSAPSITQSIKFRPDEVREVWDRKRSPVGKDLPRLIDKLQVNDSPSLRSFEYNVHITKSKNIFLMLQMLAAMLELSIDLTPPPDYISDERFYVDKLLGEDLGWQHPITRICTTMTQAIGAVASNVAIFAVLDLTNRLPLTDGEWSVTIESKDNDTVCVSHKKAQYGPTFTVVWVLTILLKYDRVNNSMYMDRAELTFPEDDCKFSDDQQRAAVMEKLRNAIN